LNVVSHLLSCDWSTDAVNDLGLAEAAQQAMVAAAQAGHEQVSWNREYYGREYYHYAECCYAKCFYAECRGAVAAASQSNSYTFAASVRAEASIQILFNGLHNNDRPFLPLDIKTREYYRGKYHCTVDLLFDWFGISYMTTQNFCFYLQNRLIQTSQTGGQWYSDISPLEYSPVGSLMEL
jgi:hypothetical protein